MSKKFFEEFRDLCMKREASLGYSEKWNVKSNSINSDEILLQNTYLNSSDQVLGRDREQPKKSGQKVLAQTLGCFNKKITQRVQWIDQGNGKKTGLLI